MCCGEALVLGAADGHQRAVGLPAVGVHVRMNQVTLHGCLTVICLGVSPGMT